MNVTGGLKKTKAAGGISKRKGGPAPMQVQMMTWKLARTCGAGMRNAPRFSSRAQYLMISDMTYMQAPPMCAIKLDSCQHWHEHDPYMRQSESQEADLAAWQSTGHSCGEAKMEIGKAIIRFAALHHQMQDMGGVPTVGGGRRGSFRRSMARLSTPAAASARHSRSAL